MSLDHSATVTSSRLRRRASGGGDHRHENLSPKNELCPVPLPITVHMIIECMLDQYNSVVLTLLPKRLQARTQSRFFPARHALPPDSKPVCTGTPPRFQSQSVALLDRHPHGFTGLCRPRSGLPFQTLPVLFNGHSTTPPPGNWADANLNLGLLQEGLDVVLLAPFRDLQVVARDVEDPGVLERNRFLIIGYETH